jgi:serine/threonine-protein kinase
MALTIAIGDLVDAKYRVVRVIGEGGWGIVFEAENVRTLKRVALKVLRAQAGVTPDIQTRFQREAQAAGRIGSEHIVEVFDLGTLEDGSNYMVMELLSGQDMASRLREVGAIEPVAMVRLLIQLLDGLKAAHDAGILHRDLKPENLFLVPTRGGDEFVKILDFGISKFSAEGINSATMTGAVLGSPCYMAPEQARGLKHVDARTDLYAVGTLMFECLTGRVPFEGENFNDLMFKIVLAPRPNPLDVNPNLDPALAAIIVKALSTEPADRFPNAEAFRAALIGWLESKGLPSVRPPELKRVVRPTPRAGNDPRPSHQLRASHEPRVITPAVQTERMGTPVGTPPPQLRPEATLRLDGGAETPLASSSPTPGGRTLPSQAAQRRSRLALTVSSVLVVLLVAGGVAVIRVRGHAPAAPPPAPAAEAVPSAVQPTPSPVPPRAPSGAGASAAANAVASVASEVALAPPVPVPAPNTPAAPGARALGTSASKGRVSAGAKGGGAPNNAVEPAKSPEAAPVASVPPAPATVSPTPKPVSTVEGREIRTGL